MTMAVARLVVRDDQETPPPSPRAVSEAERQVWLTRRRALIMELGAIEDYLGMARSIAPRSERHDRTRRSQEAT